MTTRPGREFLPALRELEQRLSVPIPERVRILRELEFDLEQLRARFMAKGISVEEAHARALEALVPGDVALEQLEDLHAPLYRRLTSHVRDDRLRLLERTTLALASAVVLVIETLFLIRMRSGTFQIPPHLLWPVLSAATLLFAVIAVNVSRFWIKGELHPPGLRAGAILGLSGATLVAGLTGVFIDFYGISATLAISPEMAETVLPQWLLRDSALLSMSILIALAGGLAWFVMTQWLTAVSAAYRDVLGLGPSTSSTGDGNHG